MKEIVSTCICFICVFMLIGCAKDTSKEQVATNQQVQSNQKNENNQTTQANEDKIKDIINGKDNTPVDKEQYIKSIISTTQLISEDFKNVSDAMNKSQLDNIKLYSDNIINDCNHLKAFTPPTEFKEAQNKINEACDIYINIYGQMYEKAKTQDINWLNKSSSKLSKANTLIEEATKDFKK